MYTREMLKERHPNAGGRPRAVVDAPVIGSTTVVSCLTICAAPSHSTTGWSRESIGFEVSVARTNDGKAPATPPCGARRSVHHHHVSRWHDKSGRSPHTLSTSTHSDAQVRCGRTEEVLHVALCTPLHMLHSPKLCMHSQLLFHGRKASTVTRFTLSWSMPQILVEGPHTLAVATSLGSINDRSS